MTRRAIFLAYCAYAPFIQTLASLFFWSAAGAKGDPNVAVWSGLLFIIPLSAWFMLETTVFNCDVLASHFSFSSHCAVYSYFYVTKVVGEVNGTPAPLPLDHQALPITMAALACASIALLKTWDNMRSKQGSNAAPPEDK